MERIKRTLSMGISTVWAIVVIVVVAVIIATGFLVYGYFWQPNEPKPEPKLAVGESDIFGVYESYTGEGKVFKSLNLKSLKNDQINVSIISTTNNCIGDLDEIFVVKGDNAIFNKNGCVLEITFHDGVSIDVFEKDCSFYHGSSCSFEGIYTKKSII